MLEGSSSLFFPCLKARPLVSRFVPCLKGSYNCGWWLVLLQEAHPWPRYLGSSHAWRLVLFILSMLESSSPCVLIVPSLEARISGGVDHPFAVSSSLTEIPEIVPCLKASPLSSFHAWKLVGPLCLYCIRPLFGGSYFWWSSSTFLRGSSSCAWDSWNRPMLGVLSSLHVFFPCLKTRPPIVSWYAPLLEAYIRGWWLVLLPASLSYAYLESSQK